MALIVEDGSIVSNANSYVTVAEARAYADARKKTLPEDDAVLESFLIHAKDYLEAQRSEFVGRKYSREQSLQWPRSGVFIDGYSVANDVIPTELKSAQIELAVAIQSGIDLFPTASGAFIVREKVGPIETEYSTAVGSSNYFSIPSVDYLLAPLFGQSTFLKTVRV